MQTNSEIYQVECVEYRITDPTNKWVKVVGFFSWENDVIIPSSVTIGGEEYKVTSIGEEAFGGCSSLRSITIPSSVTSIGEWAFSGCSSLTSITLPSSVTSIGYMAFDGCSNLTSITIPSSVTSIRDRAFKDCKSLTSITLPSSVTSIGVGAFKSCSSLTSITIPSSVTSIGEEAFEGCEQLCSITIPSSVTSIGVRAFDGCKSLTSITIPSSMTSIGGGAFDGCNSLTSITIPSSVTSIGDGAFWGCSSLTSIIIPTHITNIYKLDIPKGIRIIRKNVIVSDKLESHYNQGLEFHKLADYDQAFKHFKEAATNPFQFEPAQGEYAELLNGVHKHIMNNEMSQAQQGYNIYTNLTGETCSIVEICLKAGGIPESLRTDDGYAGAQYYMGLYYERGYSVQKDFAEAIKWYRKAADQDQTDAQFRLGVCYYIGEGVDKSTEEAIKYCRKAAEKGHQMSKEMLEYMAQQLG